MKQGSAPMRTDEELLDIIAAIRAATPPPPPVLPVEQWGFFYSPVHAFRRRFQLAVAGRGRKLTQMVQLLAAVTNTPESVAQMALDAVVPFDHEAELDDPDNDAELLERATTVMGLNPRAVAWCAAAAN